MELESVLLYEQSLDIIPHAIVVLCGLNAEDVGDDEVVVEVLEYFVVHVALFECGAAGEESHLHIGVEGVEAVRRGLGLGFTPILILSAQNPPL